MVHSLVIQNLIKTALLEDLSHGDDVTSRATLSGDVQAQAVMNARGEGVVCGVEIAAEVFRAVDSDLAIDFSVQDGDHLLPGTQILSVKGSAASLLMAERVALNFISHLSGIATETRRYVEAVQGTQAKITCTRKTLPGLRAVQKYAVRCGGGSNHRFSLGDAILIKDNHIAIAGGIKAALEKATAYKGHMMALEIEVDTLEQLQDVLDFADKNPRSVDVVLLDNMSNDHLRKAVPMVDGALITEASGGVNLSTVKGIAETGVGFISVGALTHSVIALDIGLDIET